MGDGTRIPFLILIALVAVSVASLFASLTSGTFPISAQQVIDSVIFPAQGVVHDVIWRLRAPRAAAVYGAGGVLGLVAALWLPRGTMRRAWVLLFAVLLGGSVATAVDAAARWLGA